jgi:hypothetical protein
VGLGYFVRSADLYTVTRVPETPRLIGHTHIYIVSCDLLVLGLLAWPTHFIEVFVCVELIRITVTANKRQEADGREKL